MLNVLIGSHGVGKSTLLNEIKPLRPDYYFTDGFSRPVKRGLGGIQFQDKDIVEQRIINELTLWGWENYIGQNVVSARSLIDAIIYTEYYHPKIDTSFLRYKFRKTKENVVFFYIPIEFPIINDGERYTDEEDREKINNKIQLFLQQEDISFITLSGSINDRLQQALIQMK